MPSGSLWLHPLHTSANGTHPIQLFPSSMKRTLTDVQALHGFVTELAHDSSSQFESPGLAAAQFSPASWQVFLQGSGMIISSVTEVAEASQTIVSLSLCFCEVVHVKAAEQHLIALGRRACVSQDEQSKQGKRRNLDGPFSEVWVLVMDGDEDDLRSVLSAMSALGAIQEDFQNIYHLSDKPIGTGCFSAVYSGKLIQNDVKTKFPAAIAEQTLYHNRPRNIAAKVFKRSRDKHVSEMATAEASLLSKVQGHPNIIGFYGLFTMPDLTADAPVNWVMAMEWCSRGDLHDYLQLTGPCKERRAAEILVGLLAALAHVHSRNIVHRDVKAENILLGEHGKPILSDFGIAAQLDDESAMKQCCGSPGYAAPEILTKKTYDEKVDIFSIGVVLYFILCGSLPFAGSDAATVLRRTVRCRVNFPKVFDNISDSMKKVILSLLQPESQNRPDATSALCQAWKTWVRNRHQLPDWLRNKEKEVLGESPVQYPMSTRVEAEALDNIESAEEVVPFETLAAVSTSLVGSVDGIPRARGTTSARSSWAASSRKARASEAICHEKEKQDHCSNSTDSTVATLCQGYRSHYSSNSCDSSEPDEVDKRLFKRGPGQKTRSLNQTIKQPTTGSAQVSQFFKRAKPPPSAGTDEDSDAWSKGNVSVKNVGTAETISGSMGPGCTKQIQPTPPTAPKTTNERVQRYLFKRRDSTADSVLQCGHRSFKPLITRCGDGMPVSASSAASKDAALYSAERSSSKDLPKYSISLSKERISSSSRGCCTFGSGWSQAESSRESNGTPRLSFGSSVHEEMLKEPTCFASKHGRAEFLTDVGATSRSTWQDKLPIQSV